MKHIFSYKKYLIWCNEGGGHPQSWAKGCDKQEVITGRVTNKDSGIVFNSMEDWENIEPLYMGTIAGTTAYSTTTAFTSGAWIPF